MLLDPTPDLVLISTGLPRPNEATLWCRTPSAGQLTWTCELLPEDGSDAGVGAQVSAQLACEGARRVDATSEASDYTITETLDGLTPSSSYRVTTRFESGSGRPIITSAQFETAPRPGHSPAPGSSWSFGFGSCHMPFESGGTVDSRSTIAIAAARSALQAHEAKFFLAIGDQMYSDLPEGHSLFSDDYLAQCLSREDASPAEHAKTLADCSAAQIRSLYQQRYRQFWSVPEWRELLADQSVAMIWDDHEIVDNWGSISDHSGEAWERIWSGARLAALDYEEAITGHRTPDRATFDKVFDFGTTTVVMLDLRSARRPNLDARDQDRVLSDAQFEWLAQALSERTEQAALFLVSTVPVAHVPPRTLHAVSQLLPDAGDLSDRWSSSGHRSDRDRLLTMLSEHAARCGKQRIALLAGDIHVGGAQQLTWPQTPGRTNRGYGERSILQFVSSALSNANLRVARELSAKSMSMTKSLQVADECVDVELLRGVSAAHQNPVVDLNVGIVSLLTPEEAGAHTQVRFGLHGSAGCYLDSGWI